MDFALELVISFLLVMSGIFGFVGSYGLVKLRDTMQRLHAPTKATTLGVGGVLIASILYVYLSEGRVSFHELLVTFFLFLTAPVSANFMAKAYMARNIREESLPPTGREVGWASYDDPPDTRT
jgi:multicomponent K+:H+ antiporter subunit G